MKNIISTYNNLPNKRQEETTAYMFILPFVVGFFIFYILPILYCFLISVLDFNGYAKVSDIFKGEIPFVGLENFINIFKDRVAMKSLQNTAKFSLMFVPAKTMFALALALLLNQRLFLRGVSRSFMLMPYVANVVAIAMVFSILLDDAGPISAIFNLFGLESPLWLMDKRTALPTVVFISVWQSSSYTALIFLAGLQNVPTVLYESARIDGASLWQTFIKITLPMISPTTFFVIISNTIGSFMNYGLIKNLTDGGPGYETRTLIYNIIEEAFSFNHFSFGTAQAILLFFIILIITLIQWWGQKKWVHY